MYLPKLMFAISNYFNKAGTKKFIATNYATGVKQHIDDELYVPRHQIFIFW